MSPDIHNHQSIEKEIGSFHRKGEWFIHARDFCCLCLQKVDVEEDDDQNLGNETMNHTDFEIMYPGRKVSHGRDAPLCETDADAGTSNEGANKRNRSEDTVATVMLQAPTYHYPGMCACQCVCVCAPKGARRRGSVSSDCFCLCLRAMFPHSPTLAPPFTFLIFDDCGTCTFVTVFLSKRQTIKHKHP